jgi:hypothetical protein
MLDAGGTCSMQCGSRWFTLHRPDESLELSSLLRWKLPASASLAHASTPKYSTHTLRREAHLLRDLYGGDDHVYLHRPTMALTSHAELLLVNRRSTRAPAHVHPGSCTVVHLRLKITNEQIADLICLHVYARERDARAHYARRPDAHG